MPLLIHAVQTSKKRSADALVKPLPQSAKELAAQALSNLWQRLFRSYQHFSQPGCDSFVIDAAVGAAPITSGAKGTGRQRGMQWAPGFSTASTCDALIQHLFRCNEHFDALSWVIAFCLIDRLQLHHYVRQRLQNISFWKPLHSSPASFQLVKEDAPQLLFTAYTLAFKWHLDYTVSIKYLTNLLPQQRHARTAILRATVEDELVVLQALDYNCAVSDHHVAQLMDHFLTAAERTCVLHVVHHD
ncbi:hypothetical protein ABB37_04887 [Leptomonas pyrrhocoris]|uniref:Uncharacterized protein n=1 Tax=Leptomonas pyrrhocoris TaxID=157538 RepID=A0A0N0DVR5_LEPPY|nr:hypothetical protein ABB37_04887 [Leptomonas pyrrhocoris]KPA80718.1 hypothetical protein ABB37_04887 [Leptomonas pyrrhocoris]|eukprot:XP_015659157.1 hypothetical protein ABB37_04887 [Leptomonas pyrrhocoris]